MMRARQRRRALQLRKIAMCKKGLLAAKIVMAMNSLKARHYLTRADVLPIDETPWAHIKATKQDGAAMQLMGITWGAFDVLLTTFSPIIEALWESRKSGSDNKRGAGRRRLLKACDVLALTLAWIHVPTYTVMLCERVRSSISSVSVALPASSSSPVGFSSTAPASIMAWMAPLISFALFTCGCMVPDPVGFLVSHRRENRCLSDSFSRSCICRCPMATAL